MTLLEAIVLGIVQGLTEFLPISSTAHLRVIPALLGWEDPGAAFSAVIQIGTVVAVLFYFRKDLWDIVTGLLRGIRDRKPLADPHARLGWFIGAGTVPIVVFGLAFEDQIKTGLRSLWVIAGALIAVGVLMAVADRVAESRRRNGDGGVTLGDALVVGLAQACALIPGVSRSGSTLAAGLFRGLSRAEAARFSFLLSVPAVTAAGLKELYELVVEQGLAGVGAVNLVAGTVVSFVVGYAAIAGLLAFLRTRTVTVFVVYRILIGLGLIALVGAGILQA